MSDDVPHPRATNAQASPASTTPQTSAPIGDPDETPPADGKPKRPLTRWLKDHSRVATAVAVAALLVAVAALGRDYFGWSAGPNPPTATTPTSDPAALPVIITGVVPTDGKPGLGGSVELQLSVNREPEKGHEYWFFSELRLPNPTHTVYYAVKHVSDEIGARRYVRDLSKATKDWPRTWYIVDVSPQDLKYVRQNHENLDDTSWDINRHFPPDSIIASNKWTVIRTRN
ncbi:hypothetical protein [Streptosporangium sp. NPDC006007]|uniref:hypothetical protein n=1 Tax=Streptosporangium sp. NPDC006007 TaxID=3154575 RepID=UPI00339E8B63